MIARFAAAGVCWIIAVLAAVQASHGLSWAPDAEALRRTSRLERVALLSSVRGLLPRYTAASLELALEWERAGDRDRAEQLLLEAARLDRRYLPAWTLANFYFRGEDRENFWLWGPRAASLCFDDFRPLLRLADAWEPDPRRFVERLGDRPELLRAYLDFLIGGRRWSDAQIVAELLAAHAVSSDQLRFEDLARRLREL